MSEYLCFYGWYFMSFCHEWVILLKNILQSICDFWMMHFDQMSPDYDSTLNLDCWDLRPQDWDLTISNQKEELGISSSWCSGYLILTVVCFTCTRWATCYICLLFLQPQVGMCPCCWVLDARHCDRVTECLWIDFILLLFVHLNYSELRPYTTTWLKWIDSPGLLICWFV